jgi:signal transduction histidine kinase
VQAICIAGLAGLVLVVFLAVALGIGRVPSSRQTTLLAFSMIAAVVVALLYQPLRKRMVAIANRLLANEHGSADDVLRAFGTRLAQPIPFDELLLQLAESLRRTLALSSAEVWTGSGGLFKRAASDPDMGPGNVILSRREESVVARASVSGTAWVSTWLPQLVSGRERGTLRAVPVTHSGELLGLIVVERPGAGEPFSADDDRVLAALARQLGLALNNVRLGSALQASLDELRRQAEELRESRARVVAAGDAERRRIERDLHDGAQQHLIALAVNLRLARELSRSDPAAAQSLLDELASDVKDALERFRELAHGIYPPILEARGLADGLRAVAARGPIRARVETDSAIERHSPEVEATVYFCCLEALQNAGKHAGEGAHATVRLWEDVDSLRFEVIDDGIGFDPSSRHRGAGLTNIEDRLGALGGRLAVRSSQGDGTTIAGVVPLGR